MTPSPKKILICAAVAAALSMAADVSAFRCGDEIVSRGDSRAQVLVKCGKPTHKDRTAAGKGKRGKQKKQGVEKWFYNCGRNDFLYVLTFEDGVVTRVDTEGRGKGPSDCLGR